MVTGQCWVLHWNEWLAVVFHEYRHLHFSNPQLVCYSIWKNVLIIGESNLCWSFDI